MLVIQGGVVLTPEMRFERADVVIDGGKIASVGRPGRRVGRADVIDARGRFVVPGFVVERVLVESCGIYFDDEPAPSANRRISS